MLDKLKKLTHYICDRCNDPTTLGATKLNKILWYSDRLAFLWLGKPITNETYIKKQFGPVPKHIDEVVSFLEDEGDLVEKWVRDIYPRREYISLKEPDISVFSAEEISLVDGLIDKICNHHTATSISNASHGKIWELASIGEDIPHATIFADELGDIDEHDIDWAQRELSLVA